MKFIATFFCKSCLCQFECNLGAAKAAIKERMDVVYVDEMDQNYVKSAETEYRSNCNLIKVQKI